MKAKLDGDAKAFFAKVREQVAKAKRGYPAPLEIVACAEAAATLPFDEGRKVERERFKRWSTRRNRRRCATCSSPSARPPRSRTCRRTRRCAPINKAAVIGAGTMGGGIAMSFANAGIPVTVVETTQEALDKGLAKIQANYAATVPRAAWRSPTWTSAWA